MQQTEAIASSPTQHLPLSQRAPFRAVQRALFYVMMVALALIFAGPLLWMLSTSLKTAPQVYTVPPIWIPNPVRLINYPEALATRPYEIYT